MSVAASLHSVAEAQERVLQLMHPLETETVPLYAAPRRVLAADAVSTALVPPRANSSMDGYAVRAADTAAPPSQLRVVEHIPAGTAPQRTVGPGEAALIMTGALLPAGADAVVRREDTDDGTDTVRIEVSVAAGTAVRAAGEDLHPGDVIAPAGHRLRSGDLAALAAGGLARVQVHRRPRVAVISSGDELVEPGQPAAAEQVVDSNRGALIAAVAEAGGLPLDFGIARDRPEAVLERLQQAAEAADLVLSSAGVSVGDHDHVREAVARLGEVSLWRVAMRPGKPLVVGRLGDVPFLGLPGNPVSSQVTFELFARPALLALQGAAQVHRRRFAAVAAEPISKPAGLETFHRGVLETTPGELPRLRLTGPQGSGISRSLVLAGCLAVLPAESARVEAGTVVEVIPLD